MRKKESITKARKSEILALSYRSRINKDIFRLSIRESHLMPELQQPLFRINQLSIKNLLFTLLSVCLLVSVNAQPTAGLVAYWKMDGNFTDSGPYNITGTNSGATATTNSAGTANKAMAFSNPTGTVVQYGSHAINSNVNFSGSQDFSITMNIYLNAPYVHTGGLYDNNLNFNGPGVWYWNVSGYPQIQFNYKNASVGTTNGALQLGVWQRIACIRQSGVLKVYINAVLINSTSEGTGTPGYGTAGKFGTMWYSLQTPPGYNGHNGKIDEVRIYNRALSQSEITELYVLPVEFASFTAVKINKDVQLRWQTDDETNCSHYNIQRSTDGINFTNVGQQTANGSSSISSIYRFTDFTAKEELNANSFFYRIESVDMNGGKNYSSIINIKLTSTTERLLVLQNPADEDLRLQITSPVKESVSIIITDLAGRRVSTDNIVLDKGVNACTLSAGRLPRGQYFVSVAGQTLGPTKRFLKQ